MDLRIDLIIQAELDLFLGPEPNLRVRPSSIGKNEYQ